MKSIDIGWAAFYEDAATAFSPEFQAEMANQLIVAFNALVEIDNFAQDKGGHVAHWNVRTENDLSRWLRLCGDCCTKYIIKTQKIDA